MNGLPASNVPIIIRRIDGKKQKFSSADQNGETRRSGPNGEVYFRLDMPLTAGNVKLQLETADGGLEKANSTFTLRPEVSMVNEFLLIRIPMGGVEQIQEIGSISRTEVQLPEAKNVSLHFFVISGGKIVYETTKQIQSVNTAFGFQITHKMAPVSRVVAYYVNKDNYAIADSLLVRVQEKCENPIGVSFEGSSIEKNASFFK